MPVLPQRWCRSLWFFVLMNSFLNGKRESLALVEFSTKISTRFTHGRKLLTWKFDPLDCRLAHAQLLVEAGALVNAPDMDGKTPLVWAASNRVRYKPSAVQQESI